MTIGDYLARVSAELYRQGWRRVDVATNEPYDDHLPTRFSVTSIIDGDLGTIYLTFEKKKEKLY